MPRRATARSERVSDPIARHDVQPLARAARKSLEEVRVRFESAAASSPIGMAIVDFSGRWIQVNDALCAITGQAREQFQATTLSAITHPEDADSDQRSFYDLLVGQRSSYQVEKRFRHAFGHYIWVLLTVSLVRDSRGEPLYVVSQVQNIEERKERAEHLEYLIDHDALTGLINRRRFQSALDSEADRLLRYGPKGAVLIIDLDNFKSVNDSFGHKAGDDLLQRVAAALRHRMRRTDLLARVGGDEFAMLLPEADQDQAQLVAEGIVRTVSRQVATMGEQAIPITASVGIALFDGKRPAEMLEFADLAMYEAKEAGRNRTAIYRPGGEGGGRISQRTEVEQIRTALGEDRVLLYCQPIVELGQVAVTRYELLLRIRTDKGSEPISPGSFLYVAERFNLIQEIDSWVVGRAIELLAEHGRSRKPLALHVNLSWKSIGDARISALIEDAVPKAGIDPASLVFELTEAAAISNLEEANAFASRLHVRGCGLAIDDFGAGLSSFHNLESMPFDYVKIDGDFIRGIVTNSMDRLVVAAIVGIARGMKKRTIAEFVPDEDARRLLEEMGVDYAQGYHLGLPRPLRELLPSPTDSIRPL